MARELRLGFAMGGGVSLGTFSGAALSEAIKLAVLHGGYTDGGQWQRYDRVVIDVFSGASAGAMALALMLRTLTERAPEAEERARHRLENDFGDEVAEAFHRLPDAAKRDLIAAQAVQDAQEDVWVDEVSIDRLLGMDAGKPARPINDRRSTIDGDPGAERSGSTADSRATDSSLPYTAGILDRGAVDDIARHRIGFSGALDLSGRRLLADRVLFACTLSNTTPILVDSRRDLDPSKVGWLGLADGLTSYEHKEVRVFDLSFVERAPDSPSRWCRYHAADKVEDPTTGIGDLRGSRAWAKITATAIACGAFPFAFEPVVLTRKRYEFAERWPKRLSDAGIDAYPFTYFDGGAFNNEPIREAFRMAAFMDALRPGHDYDRRIIFVDPKVGVVDPDFRVPVHVQWLLQESNALKALGGADLVRKASLDRLAPHAASVLTAFMDQAQMVEEDKVYGARRRFQERATVRGILAHALSNHPAARDFEKLRNYCDGRLAERADRIAMPEGAIDLTGELNRVIAEEPGYLPDLRGRAERFHGLVHPERSTHAAQWLRALAFVALDLAMDMPGKRANDRLIAIAPVLDVGPPPQGQTIELPGGRVAGFGGFTSAVPGRYETAMGRYCAREFLEAAHMIPSADPPAPAPLWGPGQEADYRRDLDRGLGLLAERVGEAVRASHLVHIFPGVDTALKAAVAKIAVNKVAGLSRTPHPTTHFQFNIAVPDGRYELDGPGLADRDLGAIKAAELVMQAGAGAATGSGPSPSPASAPAWFIVTFVDWDEEAGAWSGPFIDEDAQMLPIHRDGPGPLPDRLVCTVALPDADLVRQATLWPDGRFTATLDVATHEGERGIAGFWGVEAGVAGLEERLW
jgi:predicted acylesterase/phospholipase RssA